MHGCAEALLRLFWIGAACFVVALAACGGLGGLVFRFGFWPGAGVGALAGVVLVLVVILLWWLGVPL